MNYPVGTLLKCDSWRMPVWYKHGYWVILELNVLGGKNAKLKQIGAQGVLAMICDSTNVFNPGRAGSELDVRKSLLKIMGNKQKRIIVTSFASNVARMESIFYCAEKIGRQISLVGRSMHRIYLSGIPNSWRTRRPTH